MGGWDPYVSASSRRLQAQLQVERLRKRGIDAQSIEIEGRNIATTFWGKSWCLHLESYSDYENRLPRGRTYVRNGSVCHLEILHGEVNAYVSGSSMYEVSIKIQALKLEKWQSVKEQCSGQIGSLLELLKGELSNSVMQVVTARDTGLFPSPKEISLRCSCPDQAVMCKHIAAVLYGVGARLDREPALLFKLRGVDHEELINSNAANVMSAGASARAARRRLGDDELINIFGIDLVTPSESLEAEQPEDIASITKTTGSGQKPVRTSKKTTKTKSIATNKFKSEA